MISTAPTLAQVFGKDGKIADITGIIQDFDFSKVKALYKPQNATDERSYGSFLTAHGLKALDDGLKIMIAGTTKLIGSIDPAQRSWDKVVECCMQNPLMEPDGEAISHHDQYVKNSSHDFKVDGSPDNAIVQEVTSWFNKLINDQDILDSTKIDIKVLGRILAQTGATVDSLEAFFSKEQVETQTMVDIGILRYPDIDNPYFKIHRIQLTATSDCTRTLFHEDDKNGIVGDLQCRKFKPRESVTKSMTAEARKPAITAADNLFS
ncbi:hypothetical protein E4T42_09077 [Aureobasidium subglaciale]|nr:hypothetical protein E4T42_09077 [Aureobasidium subglaciale]